MISAREEFAHVNSQQQNHRVFSGNQIPDHLQMKCCQIFLETGFTTNQAGFFLEKYFSAGQMNFFLLCYVCSFAA